MGVEIDPTKTNVVAREEIAEVVTDDVGAVANHRRRRRRRVDRELLQHGDPLRHRLHDLGIQHTAVRDEIVKVGGVEPHHSRRLSRAEGWRWPASRAAAALRRSNRRAVVVHVLVSAGNRLEHRDLSLEESEERRSLSLEQKPFVAMQSNVGRARGKRRGFVVRQLREQRNLLDQLTSDHRALRPCVAFARRPLASHPECPPRVILKRSEGSLSLEAV